ncbi:MAG: hypothetical protein KIT84_34325 [Labilithrix sp.]|nr:hypothetical protein [Labilithrix sp.]MCW5816124.1 hypothetical protein [Labilithrix sp.]
MSDTTEARPGAPRPVAAGSAPRPPAPSTARLAPRAPAKPAAPPAASTPRALPPDDGDFDELRSSAVIPAAEEARDLLPVPPAPSTPPVPPPIPRAQSSADLLDKPRAPAPMKSLFGGSVAPTPTAPLVVEPVTQPMAPPASVPPAAAPVAPVAPVVPEPITLSNQAHDQLQQILRGVLESTLAPVLAKQQELEARLEALSRAPVSRQPSSAALPAMRSMAPSIDITGSLAPAGPRPSLVMTSYGPVSVLPGPAPRPAIETALENVGPIDVPDFAGKRKFAGRIIIGVLIAGVFSAIVATVLSYS